MQLLRDLQADKTPQAQRLRQTLVETIERWGAAPDKSQAQAELVGSLLGVEAGVAELLLGTVQPLAERLYKEGKRIGTASQQGKSIRAMSRALGTLADGLQQIIDAVSEADQSLRLSAHKRIDEAREQLKAVGFRG
ncbi:MAG: hypothetical protein ACAI38_13750 [Myxococcota bacterium]